MSQSHESWKDINVDEEVAAMAAQAAVAQNVQIDWDKQSLVDVTTMFD